MELMRQDWTAIMEMPYDFFVKSLKWKVDLEEEKRRKFDEKTKGKRVDRHATSGKLRPGLR